MFHLVVLSAGEECPLNSLFGLINSNIGKYYKIDISDLTCEGKFGFDTPLGFDEPMGWVVPESALIESLNYALEDVTRFYGLKSVNNKDGRIVEIKLANIHNIPIYAFTHKDGILYIYDKSL